MACVASLLALKKHLKTKSFAIYFKKTTEIKKFRSSNQSPLNPKSVNRGLTVLNLEKGQVKENLVTLFKKKE